MLPRLIVTLAVGTCILTIARAEGFDWLWKAPRKHVNTVIRTAEGTKILQGPKVALLPNGALVTVVAHSNYASDAVVSDVEIEWFISHDGGLTWHRSDPLPPDAAPRLNKYPTWPVRLKDSALLTIGSYGWENSTDTPEKRKELVAQSYYLFTPEEGNAKGVVSIIHRVWMSRSDDGGKTWKTGDIALAAPMPHLALYGDPLVTRGGTVIQPMWGRFDLKREPKRVSSLVLRSEDNGASWELRTVAKAVDFDFNETSIAEAPNGDLVESRRLEQQPRLFRNGVRERDSRVCARCGNTRTPVVALIRTTGQRELWTAISTDAGRTWSAPRNSGLLGSTPFLVTTKDALIVAVYMRRATHPGGGGFAQTGVFAAVSRDNGRTWDVEHQVCLVDTGTEVVDGYPSAVALPDGSVYAVYGFQGARAIGGTRFHPRGHDSGR